MSAKTIKILLWVSLFAVAMGFLETAVVVYMRKLYYPDGFIFPLKVIEFSIALTEFFREIATLIMLAGVGIIAGRTNTERFAWFIYTFAVWDIFYYVFLKVLLNWPASFFTWDILFLVPVTWVGPVIAPIINSLTMIVLALLIVKTIDKTGNARLGKWVWTLLIVGSLVVIVSYTEEYVTFMLQKFNLWQLLGVSGSDQVISYACTFVPKRFSWWIFLCGCAMHFTAIAMFAKKQLIISKQGLTRG